MKSRIARSLILLLCVGASLTGPAWAIFGLGDIVFDPTNYEQAVQQLLQMQRQYEQLRETYRTLRSEYELLLRMAERVPVDMRVRYRALATPWRPSSATNVYGTTAAWIAGINTGSNVAAGYARAVRALSAYGAALDQIPADQVDRIKATYATVELTDGANQHGIETLGRLRASAGAVERAIQSLEDDSLSPDAAMNTQMAVLNKINAAQIISVRSAQDANKLLVALAEAQIVAAKRTRDAEAEAINRHIRFVRDGKAALAAQAADASSAMRAWRMP